MSATIDPAESSIACDEPIHEWFGLSYASYLVLPRVLLQSMPVDWQRRMVDLLSEYEAAVERAGLGEQDSYHVVPTDRRGKFVKSTLPHYRRAPNMLARVGEKPIGTAPAVTEVERVQRAAEAELEITERGQQ